MRFLVAVALCLSVAAVAQSTNPGTNLPDAPVAHLETHSDTHLAASNEAEFSAFSGLTALRNAQSSTADGQTPAGGQSAGSSSSNGNVSSGNASSSKPSADADQPQTIPAHEQQPKRILGLMPNYRAVSAGVRPPPPGAKESFIIATENNFDYSQYVFVGLTSLMAEGSNTHPEFGKGVGGYWSYYWRGYIDKSAGDYLIIFAFPTLFHEDERYFAMGQGSFWKRTEYSGMSVFITPDYHGKNTFNWAEILGRGVSQAVSLTYYPSSVATPSSYFSKFGYAVGRDALTNVFREFYPDIARIASRPFHRKNKQKAS